MSQQDAFTDRDLVGFSVATANPACGSFVIGTAPTDFQVILERSRRPDYCPGKRFHSERNAGGHSYLIKRQSDY